jgi:hypothetical protein
MGKSYRFPKNPLCVYCQKRPGTTVDHVFARAFFGTVMPEFSMKAPSCIECNQGKGDGSDLNMSADEEHVRTLFTAMAQSHPTAKRLIQKEVRRSLARNSSLRNRFKAKVVTVDALTPTGIVVPNLPALQLNDDDRAKIQRVLAKMVKGLCYTMSEVTWPDPSPLPHDWRVVVEHVNAEKLLELNQRFDRCPRHSEWTGMGSENAIRFRGASEARDSHKMLWLLIFYDALSYFAYTEPIEVQISHSPSLND